MKLRVLVNSQQALQNLVAAKLPARTSFRLRKFIRESGQILEDYEKSRRELVMKYGDTDEKGNTNVTQTCMVPFMEDLNVILDTEIELEVPEVTVPELGDIQISVMDASWLDYLIKE